MTTLAIIGGSRAYDLLARDFFGERRPVERVETPFGSVGNIHLFSSAGISFYFLSRHGDVGYTCAAPFVNYRANIWALKSLGVERIVAWSGPGVINPAMEVGGYAVPHDLIDFTKQRPSTFFTRRGLGFIRMAEPFCPTLRHALLYAVGERRIPVYDEAVYLCTEGPRLETPAEIRLFYSYGADLVGMTLIPEAFLARELEICYGAVCYLTNYAEGVAERAFAAGTLFEGMQTDAERIAVEEALERLPIVAVEALKAAADHPRDCACKEAMRRYKKRGDITDDWKSWIEP
jgi:5'-methylthioadenosine phosphorylase